MTELTATTDDSHSGKHKEARKLHPAEAKDTDAMTVDAHSGRLPRHDNGLLDMTPHGKYVAMAEENARRSPLLRLPPELRNRIFELALSGPVIYVDNRYPYRAVPFTTDLQSLLRPLLVCRQIYHEVALLPFKVNAFETSDPCTMEYFLGEMLRAVVREAITSIQIWADEAWEDAVCFGMGVEVYIQHIKKYQIHKLYSSAMFNTVPNLRTVRLLFAAYDPSWMDYDAVSFRSLYMRKMAAFEALVREEMKDFNFDVVVEARGEYDEGEGEEWKDDKEGDKNGENEDEDGDSEDEQDQDEEDQEDEDQDEKEDDGDSEGHDI